MKAYTAEMKWRGMFEAATADVEAGKVEGSVTGYCGFDPSSSSLHVGSLIPVLGLMRLQQTGNRPIALVGGATGLIGDPSGKSSERPLLSADEVRANVDGIRSQLERFLDFDGPRGALVVNNLDWLGKFSFVDFLREIGKHFRVGTMMGKESVRSRINDRDQGMSFTEFSYMLLQATDFLHLHQTYDCSLQVGGADQWGNITAGTELIRRKAAGAAHGLTFPLLLTASGKKFGKSEEGALFIDAERTRPYAIYQYFVQSDDRDVPRLLRWFTMSEQAQIEAIEAEHNERPERRVAQKALAHAVVTLIHGRDEAERCVRASKVLFGGAIEDLSEEDLLGIFAEVPSTTTAPSRLADEGWNLVDALVETGLASSKGDARRRVKGGGVYVNNQRVDSEALSLTRDHLATPRTLVLRMGKKNYHVVKFAD